MTVSSTNRVREHRARERAGKVLLHLEVDEVDVTELLVRHGLLPPRRDCDRTELAAALSTLIRRLTDADKAQRM
jgi:hypothetical protein